MRLGTYYRSLVLRHLGLIESTTALRVLDVGSYDGYILSTLPAKLKVGIDLAPAKRSYWPVWPADALNLPFAAETFDLVMALDIIEHTPCDEEFLQSLIRVVTPDGAVWISTPSAGFRIFPACFTSWLSYQWGHLVIGYTQQQLADKLPTNVEITWMTWHAPYYRLLYFPLRLLWGLTKPLARWLLQQIVRLDAHRIYGYSGFILGCIKKVSE